MSKTPEEMAQDYISTIADTHSVKAACEKAFITGYQAAQEHAHAALEEAEAKIQELQDQLADADKVMPDTCDHILDMSKMVDVNGWVSVKDRLPELGTVVLVAKDIGSVNTTYFGVNGFRDESVTHWMPLPEPPKEEE